MGSTSCSCLSEQLIICLFWTTHGFQYSKKNSENSEFKRKNKKYWQQEPCLNHGKRKVSFFITVLDIIAYSMHKLLLSELRSKIRLMRHNKQSEFRLVIKRYLYNEFNILFIINKSQFIFSFDMSRFN